MKKTDSFYVKGKVDRGLITAVLILTVLGLFAVYSATRTFHSNTNIIVQAVAVGIGFFLMLGASYVDYEIYERYSSFIFIGYMCMLLIVLGAGITGIWGSKSWIKIFGISIQPSEFAKVGFIITISSHLEKLKGEVNKFRGLAGLLIHLALPVFLVLLQPDLGTCLVFIAIFAVLLFGAGLSPKIFVPVIGIGAASLPVIYRFLSVYQKKRILVFINPDIDPTGGGYNVIQSKTALGSGGFFGCGYLQGISTQNGYLPAKHTDFIFSSFSEEFGFLGSLFMILLLMFIVVRIMAIARRANTLFGKYVCTGIGAMLFFHTFENIGMCMGLMPVTGIPLPFVSYGGSSMVTNFICIGVVLSIARGSGNIFEFESRKE